MSYNAHDAYLESRILSADPIELTRLLYQAAIKAVREARRHLESGDIPSRARCINNASEILIELVRSLDFERGGQISVSLDQLYDYMLRQLTEGHVHQNDAPLAEVLSLLVTLSEGWEGVRRQPEPAETAWSAPVASVDAAQSVSHNWSF